MHSGFSPAPAGRPPSVVLNPASYEAIGSVLRNIAFATPGSAVYPTANMSIGYPFSVSEPVVYVKMYWLNGAAASGNLDVGIYDDLGNLLVSSGSTAQGTINVKQELNTTDFSPIPGTRYYCFIACDNGTGALFRWAPAQAAQMASVGCVQVAANFPLVTGVTFVKAATAYLPIFGASQLATF